MRKRPGRIKVFLLRVSIKQYNEIKSTVEMYIEVCIFVYIWLFLIFEMIFYLMLYLYIMQNQY